MIRLFMGLSNRSQDRKLQAAQSRSVSEFQTKVDPKGAI